MNRQELLSHIKSGCKIFCDKDIEGMFIYDDLSNLTFNNCFIVGDFSSSNLSNTTFSNCNLKTCTFNYANIDKAKFLNNCIDATDFSFSQYQDIKFLQNTYYGSIINSSDINYLKYNEIIGFNIYEVFHGWFGLRIYYGDKSYDVEASNYLDNDGPNELIKAFFDIYKNEMIERYFCWHDEPGALIWRVFKSNEDISIQIYNSIEASDKLINVGEEYLMNNIGSQVLDIKVKGDIACKELINAFYRIKMGSDNYVKNWFDFPDEELKKLLSVL